MRHVEPAGFWPRAIALSVDTALFLALTVPLMWLAYGEKVARIDDMRPWSLAINGLLPLLLAVAFWSTFGATPGKMLMSVHVVDIRTGKPPSVWRCMLRWIGYLVSALPLGLGFLWATIDSDRRGWHDWLAGTRVVRPRSASARGGATKGYFAAHWAGELSLPVSFWVNNVLLSVPVSMALGALVAWISLKGELLQATSMAMLVAWPLMLVMDTWCIVGAWRSAGNHVAQGGSPLWSGLTRLVMFLSALMVLSSTYVDFIPQIGPYLQMARGIDPIGQVQASLSADGSRLILNGPLGMGDGERVRLLVADATRVRWVELESPGGRVYEADRIVQIVRERQWQTRATGHCESACTLVFMAGKRRQLMPGAQLGFHRAFAGSFNPVLDQLANQELAAMYRRAGLSEDFIAQTLRTPPWQMWYPEIDRMAALGMIIAPEKTLDVQLPASKSPSRSDMADALRASRTWHALEQRFPGSIHAAATRMNALHASGASDALVRMEAQRVAQSLLPRLLQGASPMARERYVTLLAEQLRVARQAGGNACLRVLAGDPAARRNLPAALVLQESDWIVATALEPVQRADKAPTALEREVIRHSLGESAPQRLAALHIATRSPGTGADCDSTIALLVAIAQLPQGPRQLAARMAFHGS
jgi:uncharacterized RDD family membrane protein YckC